MIYQTSKNGKPFSHITMQTAQTGLPPCHLFSKLPVPADLPPADLPPADCMYLTFARRMKKWYSIPICVESAEQMKSFLIRLLFPQVILYDLPRNQM